jgi:hypothetical protein
MTARQVKKYSNFVVVLACEAWLCFSPGWSPGVAFLGALGALIAQEIRDAKSPRTSPDSKLLEEFLHVLPSHGSIAYIARLDMRGPFELERLDDLFAFHEKWNDAEHEFQNRKLERLRKRLWRLVVEFLSYGARNTWPGDKDLHSVPAEWAYTEPKRYNRVVAKLHSLADKIVSKHYKLIRFGKRKLKT